MTNIAPEHFSHCFELNINKFPARASDRTSWRFLLPGLVSGTMLVLLGLYEMFLGLRSPSGPQDAISAISDIPDYTPAITTPIFDIVFIIIGMGMITACVSSYIRYKKIIFDGKTVKVIYRPVLGEKKSFKENLKAYAGVRLRIEFFQFGFISKNKYIVELYHKDPQKIIPLYISTSGKNIRRIWEQYARALNLPALINTEEGLVSRDVKNFDKSLKEMAELGYIIDEYDSKETIPASATFVCKQDKIVLKAKKIVWDAYNFLAWIAIFTIGTMMVWGIVRLENYRQFFSPGTFYAFLAAAAVIIASVFILFRKEKIVIKPHKIVHTHKYILFSTKHDELEKSEIKAISITENPVSGRFYVAIFSNDKTIAFGSKLPIDDLRWIKKFLIHEIIK